MDDNILKQINGNLIEDSSKEKVANNPSIPVWKKETLSNNLGTLNIVQNQASNIEKDQGLIINEQMEKNSERSGKSGKPLGIIFLMILVLIIIGSIVYFLPKTSLLSSNKVNRSSTLSAELHDQYLPIWKQLFMENNNIDETYFYAHIFPKETGLNKNNPLGEQFYIKYEYRVDWAKIELTDGIIIKPNGEDHYLSLEELKKMASSGTTNHPEVNETVQDLFWQINSIIKTDTIISKSEADKKLKTCDSSIKAAPKPIQIKSFISVDSLISGASSKKRLIYGGALLLKGKTKLGLVDLVTGEVDCTETAPLM